MPKASISHIKWSAAIRIIESKYPPIALFEDIADPKDWELLAGAEGKTNPRIAETIGKLDLVPAERRVNGPGASYVMAPFVHCTPDRPGRFHDGTFGAYYAADGFETAVAETAYHQARRLSDSRDQPGWISDVRELVGRIDAKLHDLRGGSFEALLDPGSYAESQVFARTLRKSGSDGIAYPSVRNPGGQCVAVFWPDVPEIPVQDRHFRYHWDGERIDLIHELKADDSGRVYRLTD